MRAEFERLSRAISAPSLSTMRETPPIRTVRIHRSQERTHLPRRRCPQLGGGGPHRCGGNVRQPTPWNGSISGSTWRSAPTSSTRWRLVTPHSPDVPGHRAVLDRHPGCPAGGSRTQPALVRRLRRRPTGSCRRSCASAETDGLIVIELSLSGPGAAVERAPVARSPRCPRSRLLAGLMPEELRIAVVLAAWCQLRRGEVRGLRRKDVDLVLGVVTIEERGRLPCPVGRS